jgi:hypothetical protein
MEVFSGDIRADEDVDEDQRDATDHSGTGARLLRVAAHRARHPRKMPLRKSSGW